LVPEITVILTSHEMHEVDLVADRVGIIDHGQLLALDTPQGLKQRVGADSILQIKLAPGHAGKIRGALPQEFEILGDQEDSLTLRHKAGLHALPSIVGEFDAMGVQIEDLVMRRPTLEDVFIDLTGRSLRE
jgi:ABC-2 type transport system ATP-binding protein